MPKYRRKPVVIEAEEFQPTRKPWPEGVEKYTQNLSEAVDGSRSTWFGWRIQTPEGPRDVKPGDYVITGAEGEKYVCKPDAFEATYELVDDDDEGASSG